MLIAGLSKNYEGPLFLKSRSQRLMLTTPDCTFIELDWLVN